MSVRITDPNAAVWNTTAGNKALTAFTPEVDDLIVVIAASSGLAGGTTAVTDNNSSGTYTQVDSDRTGFSTTGVLTVWMRDTLIGSAASTTITIAQAGSTGGGGIALRVKGMRLTGASAVRGNGGQSTGGAGTTPAPVLSRHPLALNPVIAAVANGDNGISLTPRTGYSSRSAAGYNTPATGLQASWLESGERETTITFGGTSATAFASVSIELETLDVKQPGVDFGGVGLLAKVHEAWERTKGGILVPRLWTPEGAQI